MVLNCARCHSQPLTAAAHGTLSCPRCRGLYVPRARMVEFIADPPGLQVQSRGGDEGALCPNDKSMMIRARVDTSDGTAIYLDRCGSCQAVWFDAGEWSTLSSEHLLERLDEFWTAEWRSRQRHESEKAQYEERLREAFGPELYTRLLAMAHDLRGHPRRSQALAILREESAKH